MASCGTSRPGGSRRTISSRWRSRCTAITTPTGLLRRPRVSWRVLILPYIEEGSLYNMYNFNEPWDGPNNSRLLTMMPKVYQLPGDTTAPPGHTYYQVFVSAPSVMPHALFSTAPNDRVRMTQVTDGTSNTLMI